MTYQTGITRFSAGRIALALLASLAIFMVFAFSNARVVSADGDGSPAECLSSDMVDGSITGTNDLVTATAPEGSVVLGVCIKAGQLHTGPLTDADSDACYTIDGVGTAEATITRLQDTNECQALSHVDALFGAAPGDDDDDTGDDDDDTGDDDDDTGDDDDDTAGDDDDDGVLGGNPTPRDGTLGGNPIPDTAIGGPSDVIVPTLLTLFVLAGLGGLTALRLARRP